MPAMMNDCIEVLLLLRDRRDITQERHDQTSRHLRHPVATARMEVRGDRFEHGIPYSTRRYDRHMPTFATWLDIAIAQSNSTGIRCLYAASLMHIAWIGLCPADRARHRAIYSKPGWIRAGICFRYAPDDHGWRENDVIAALSHMSSRISY